MKCPDCGSDLTNSTRTGNGNLVCANCGRRNQETILLGDKKSAGSTTLLDDSKRFDFRERLGEGSFGSVYRAYDNELLRDVAIKIPKLHNSNDAADMALREARAASRLNHAGIVCVYDVFQRNDSIFIVNELIHGVNLQAWRESNSHSIELYCEICEKICRAVEHAHQHGIIHRDIKPSNILVDVDNNPHLLDFGLSRSRQIIDDLVSPGVPFGTPAFMAPEQVLGDAEHVDSQTDVYSCGVVLYFLLTNRLPFAGNSEAIFRQILAFEPKPPQQIDSFIPSSLQAICLKAMSKEPRNRYRSAGEMANDIRRFLGHEHVQAFTGFEPRVAKRFIRRKFTAGLASLFGLGFVGASYWGYREYRSAKPLVRVNIRCSPAKARLSLQYISVDTGLPDPAVPEIVASSDQTFMAAPGWYRVTVQHAGETWFVYRTVPKPKTQCVYHNGISIKHREWEWRKDKVVQLPSIELKEVDDVIGGMSLIEGGQLTLDRAIGKLRFQEFKIPDIWIDQSEVTADQFLDCFPEAEIERTPSPSDFLTNLNFDYALAFAEATGKQLPSAPEYIWVASNRGTTALPWRSPMGGPVPYEATLRQSDSLDTALDVKGLFSPPAEWTDSPQPQIVLPNMKFDAGPHQYEPNFFRSISGAPLEYRRPNPTVNKDTNVQQFPFERIDFSHPLVGFRCVRYAKT